MKLSLFFKLKPVQLLLGLGVLGFFGALGVDFWQEQKIVQATQEARRTEINDWAKSLYQTYLKQGFFGARYKGCYIDKNPTLCDIYYHEKTASNDNSINQSQVLKDLKTQKWEKLPLLTQAQAIRTIGKLSSKERNQLTQNLINDESLCFSPMLISALAYKIEEQFPQPEAIKNVLDLYARVEKCHPQISEKTKDSNLNPDLGLYRGGLFSYWLNDFEQAEKSLQALIKTSENGLLLSRAKYWVHQIHHQSDRNVRLKNVRQNFQDHPLSFHAILDFEAFDANLPYDTVESLRKTEASKTAQQALLNDTAMLYEAFLALDNKEMAQRTLEFLDFDSLRNDDPSFQLYIAQELHKYEELKHEKFKVLSRLFQEAPEFKTTANLRLYYPLDYAELVHLNSGDANPFLVMALIRQESSFNPTTESPVGALGLMQIMPRTAKEIRSSASREDLLSPAKNISMGSSYISGLIREFKGDTMKALAAYNAGAGNVKKWMRRYPTENSLLFSDLIPFDETREYVANIMRNRYWYEKIYPHKSLEESVAQNNNASEEDSL